MRLPGRQSPVATFAVLSVLSLAALGVALDVELSSRIENDALQNARDVALVSARLGIQPLISQRAMQIGLRSDELANADRVLRSEQIGTQIVRVKVWNRKGRVVYSDDKSLVNRSFPISSDLQEALEGQVSSDVSSLTEKEQANDRHFGRLLEVYAPLRVAGSSDPAGAFELYMPYAPIASKIASGTDRLALMLGIGLLLLWAVLMRIVVGASRRLRVQARENRHQATHDALTGLPNRLLLDTRVADAIAHANRDDETAAVLLLDLNRFKQVNDTLGHKVGDRLIVEVGNRLTEAVRTQDTVARLGGDEFAIVLPGLDGGADAMQAAERLAAVLDEPFLLEGVAVRTEPSVGVALCPEHGTDVVTLIQRADIAMYLAKADTARCVIYDPLRDPHDVNQLRLLADLRQALDTSQLSLVYQPKLDPVRGVIEGVEALLRWKHPQRGFVPPTEFVTAAEQTDLMAPITRFVVRSALAQARVWREQGRDLRVAVNISAADLADDRLARELPGLLEREGVPADRLTVELTETAVMADPARAATLLSHLSEVGVRVALDDFGTGQSSLAYLKRLPIDELKIDRSFVGSMSEGGDDAVIVTSTLRLAHELGLTVVAEGAETHEVVSRLAAEGCDLVQGYAIARPLPADKLDTWFAAAERAGVYSIPACDLTARVVPRPAQPRKAPARRSVPRLVTPLPAASRR